MPCPYDSGRQNSRGGGRGRGGGGDFISCPSLAADLQGDANKHPGGMLVCLAPSLACSSYSVIVSRVNEYLSEWTDAASSKRLSKDPLSSETS